MRREKIGMKVGLKRGRGIGEGEIELNMEGLKGFVLT
jgi:hypothetical protein